jgi:2-(1,2-epoxy-1,2-dihydrophenyl)acetyl-CoA isomerase
VADSTASDAVRYEVDGAVATITLNRPDAMNALDLATKDQLVSAVLAAAEDPAVRAVVLTGTGRAFCVGQDLKEHIRLIHDDPAKVWDTVERHYNPIATALATMPKPVIAAVNGVAAGAGASFAFACDFRLVADTAGFNLAFAGIALSCDSGSSFWLPRLVGPTKATELLLLPRTVSAAESLELGIATSVLPSAELETAAAELASKLAAGPTLAYASIKASLLHAQTHPLAEALTFEAAKMALTGASADHLGAVDAFVTKQPPTFTGS